MKIKDLTLCGIFTALLCITAFLKIPIPPVPITLQSQVVLLAGLLLGARNGCTCIFLYILLGLVGLPVFTSGGGLGYVLQPTFGYIIGFLPAAWLTGYLTGQGKNTFLRLFGITLSGLLIIYSCGMGYYCIIGSLLTDSIIGLWPLFVNFCLIFLPGDVILCLLCVLLAHRLIPLLRR